MEKIILVKRNIICIKLILIMFLMMFVNLNYESVFADNKIEFESKIFSGATLEDDFANNKVIVTMTKQESEKFLNYTINDFKDLDVEKVENLSYESSNVLRKIKTKKANSEDYAIKNEQHRSIISITLKEKNKSNVLKTIKKLEKYEHVLIAEPDHYTNFETIPNDRDYEEQWSLNGENGINIEKAWEITKGSSSVKVGIIDTGIDVDHRDIANRVDILNSMDLDGNGNGLVDTNGHGTHVAGIIGAQVDNAIGVSGINWDVDLISYKHIGVSDNYTLASNLIKAVENAKVKNVPVLNNSNGYAMAIEINESLRSSILSYDGLFVNSAGNNSNDEDNMNTRLVDCNLDNVMVVGSITSHGDRASKSNYGANNVNIYAPGQSILSTVPYSVDPDGYQSWSGTSMAAPHVTGVAALLLSIDPTLTGAELKDIILDSADKIKIDKGMVKKLNAYEAVKALKSREYNGYDIYNTENLPNNEISIDGLTVEYEGELEIPRLIDGRKVTKINNDAFLGQDKITSIFLPHTIKSIGDAAFFDCTSLEHISFAPYSDLNRINGYAFQQCYNLESITIPNTVTNISFGINSFAQNLTIYTEFSNKPSGWDAHWNKADWISVERPVVWGCSLSDDKSYVKSFIKSSANITKPNAINGISDPYRVGYTFAGWYDNAFYNGEAIESKDLLDEPNQRYYAKWLKDCEVIYNFNSDLNQNYTDTISYGEKAIEPNCTPSKTGYAFKYWALSTDSFKEYNFNYVVHENIVLKAVWEKAYRKHIVTYNLDGGDWDYRSQILVEDGENVILDSAPTKYGFIFSHFVLEGETTEYSFSTPVTTDITLKAVWDPACNNTVSFDVNEGCGNYPILNLEDGDNVAKPKIDPQKVNHIFKYWALTTNLNEEFDWNSSVYGNTTLVAVYENMVRYVNFDVNGGDDYTYLYSYLKGDSVNEFNIADPTRDNYLSNIGLCQQI